jgi:hypothetical protein
MQVLALSAYWFWTGVPTRWLKPLIALRRRDVFGGSFPRKARLLKPQQRSSPALKGGAFRPPFGNMSSEVEVFRGESQRPLYVTAVGIEHREAKIAIGKMHGKYRIPTMLKSVDQLCRQYDLVHKEQGFKSPS